MYIWIKSFTLIYHSNCLFRYCEQLSTTISSTMIPTSMSPYTTIPTSIILTTIYDTTMKSTTEIETLQPSTQKPATTTKKCISNPDSCPPGFICGKGECFPGCTSNHPCPLGMECIKPVPNAIVGYAFTYNRCFTL